MHYRVHQESASLDEWRVEIGDDEGCEQDSLAVFSGRQAQEHAWVYVLAMKAMIEKGEGGLLPLLLCEGDTLLIAFHAMTEDDKKFLEETYKIHVVGTKPGSGVDLVLLRGQGRESE